MTYVCRYAKLYQKFFYLFLFKKNDGESIDSLVFLLFPCYNDTMKNYTKVMIGFALACTLFTAAGALCTHNEAPLTASAAEGLSLFLPTSYEQFLNLENPTDACMNERYIAIADGNALYLYNRAETSYSRYLHFAGNGDARIISKLQFSPDGRLFFSTQDAQLYEYDFGNGNAEIQTNIPCSTFVVSGDTLYTAAVAPNGTTIYALSLNDELVFENVREIGTTSSNINATPRLTVSNGVLYCAIDYHIYSYLYDGNRYIENLHELSGVSYLTSFHAYNGAFYFTVNGAQNGNGLYRASFEGESTLLYEGRNLVSLFTYDNALYCVQGGSVRQLSVTETSATLTGYEIGAGSDAENRIASATDMVRAGDLLVVSDSGNNRVLVYQTKEKLFSVYDDLGGSPTEVATDGKTFAVGVGSNVLVYEYGAHEPLGVYPTGSNVTGLSCVYGAYYYTTHNRDYGIAEEDGTRVNRQNTDPVSVTSDLLGNLYVADANGSVTKYTEEEFTGNSVGTLVTETWSLPASFRSLRSDYEGNLYYLSGNYLYRNGSVYDTLSANGLVYHDAPVPTPVSFSLCFEDNDLYVNYGDFMLFTDALKFPTLSTISASGVYDSALRTADPQSISFVTVAEGSIGIQIDLNGLTETDEYLTYQSHARIEGGSAVVLAQSAPFSLVALYQDHGYTVMLCPTESCTETQYTVREHIGATRYLSNAVSVTTYPLFSKALTQRVLPRALKVEFLDTVFSASIPDYAFAYISYEYNGETYTGYVPTAYLTQANPLPIETERYHIAYLRASEEGVTFYDVNDRSNTITVTERVQVAVYESGSDTYDVVYTRDGKQYTAQVTSSMLEMSSPDPLRIGLIVILCVIAVGIAAGYAIYAIKKRRDEAE